MSASFKKSLKHIAILGCGNMARAMALGIKHKDLSFVCYTPTLTKAQDLAELLKKNGHKALATQELCELKKINGEHPFDLIVLGLKPQQLPVLVKELKESHFFPFEQEVTVLSMLAALDAKYLEGQLSHQKIIRVMPNTPTSLGAGVLAFYADKSKVPHEEISAVMNLFSACGEMFFFEKEAELEIITPYSGSGPAYIFEIARILEEGLIEQKINADVAKKMVAQTLLGASQLLANSALSFSELRDQVTSQKGVTYEALRHFKNKELESIFRGAIQKAQDRSKEIAQELKKA